MEKENKAQTILYFICAICWFICLIFDFVDKTFSTQFYMHVACAVLFTISGFLSLKKGSSDKKKE